MKRKHIKWLSLLLAMTMTAGLAASCGSNTDVEATPSPTPAVADTPEAADPTPAPADDTTTEELPVDDVAVQLRDLGGREIIAADWWTNNDAVEEPAANLRDEEWRAYRDGIFADYNFTYKQQSVSDWNGYLELFTTSVMAGDPTADLYIMSAAWAMSLMKQGLLYPINTVESIDLSNEKWNSTVTDMYTATDGNSYALTNAVYIEPKMFMYYNKRLFEDAGIDPEAPYDLQASGEWTWDKFMEFAEQLTRDTDGDGVTDVYGFVGFEQEAIAGLMFSNNAQFIKKGDDGLFYNAMSEPEFMESIQFGKDLWTRGYWVPSPEGAAWDWFLTGFRDAYAATFISEAYRAPWDGMTDPWGMVFVPKGPRATDYNSYMLENVYCLPSTISAEDADEIMFAYNLYSEPLQYDIDNPDNWKDNAFGYSRFNDTRAVDETLAMYYEGRYGANYTDLVPGIDWGSTYYWGSLVGAETVNEKIEMAKPVVDAAIAESNK